MQTKRTATKKQVESFIKKNWETMPARKIAERFGMSHDTVLRWAKAMGLKGKQEVKVYSINDVKEEHNQKKEAGQDKKFIKELIKKNEELEKIVGVKNEIDANKKVFKIEVKHKSIDSEATAVVLASDWHLEQRVEKNKNLYGNEYNLQIAEERAKQFFQNTVKLLKKEQQDVVIRQMVLWLGGDFITGNIHTENLKVCQLGPAQATVFATNILRSGIQYILDNTDVNLTIPYNHGNHARITDKVWVSTEEDNSLEYLIYNDLEYAFKDNPRVKFIAPTGSTTLMEIYGLRIAFVHGHHGLRYQGGVGGLYVPARKYVQKKFHRYGLYLLCMGHWHTYVQDTMFLCNGSLIGYDQYADSLGCEFDIPKQTFFLLDSKRKCRTVTVPIVFDI